MLKRLCLLTLCGLLILSCAACGETTEPETEETKKNLPSRPTLSLPSADTQQTVPITYVPDEAVNKFVLAMKEQASASGEGGLPEEYTLGIEQGNAPGEYILTVQGCRITVSSHKNGLSVMILSGRGEKGQKNLFSAFRMVAAAGDTSCTGDQCKAAIAFMEQQTTASNSYRVSNYVQILSYMPSIQLEGSETECRLDLLLTYYSSGKSD